MIDNLQTYSLEYDGSLTKFNNTVVIKGNTYSFVGDKCSYEIYSTDKVKYTDIHAKVEERNVYCLREEDNNNDAIYVSLTWGQNLKFHIENLKFLQETVKKLGCVIKKLISIFK